VALLASKRHDRFQKGANFRFGGNSQDGANEATLGLGWQTRPPGNSVMMAAELSSHLPGIMKGMEKDRMTASDTYEYGLAGATDHTDEAVAAWQQPQLIPGPAASAAAASSGRMDRPSESLRRAGLVGIAQAREALAEAARRAKERAEARAA
jgi:hypothetical protein